MRKPWCRQQTFDSSLAPVPECKQEFWHEFGNGPPYRYTGGGRHPRGFYGVRAGLWLMLAVMSASLCGRSIFGLGDAFDADCTDCSAQECLDPLSDLKRQRTAAADELGAMWQALYEAPVLSLRCLTPLHCDQEISAGSAVRFGSRRKAELGG